MDAKVRNMPLTWCQNYKMLNLCRVVWYFCFVSCCAFVSYHVVSSYISLCVVPCWFFKKIRHGTIKVRIQNHVILFILCPTTVSCRSRTVSFHVVLSHDRTLSEVDTETQFAAQLFLDYFVFFFFFIFF
jgi:hypothetical protein